MRMRVSSANNLNSCTISSTERSEGSCSDVMSRFVRLETVSFVDSGALGLAVGAGVEIDMDMEKSPNSKSAKQADETSETDELCRFEQHWRPAATPQNTAWELTATRCLPLFGDILAIRSRFENSPSLRSPNPTSTLKIMPYGFSASVTKMVRLR